LAAFDTMFTTSQYALIYFVIVLVLGDFIIVNSLIAILLSNFDNRKELLDEELMEDEANSIGKGIFSVFQGLRITKSDSLRSRESAESENAETVKVYERFAKLAHELLKRDKRRSAARAEDLRLKKARALIQAQTQTQTILHRARKGRDQVRSTHSRLKDFSARVSSVFSLRVTQCGEFALQLRMISASIHSFSC